MNCLLCFKEENCHLLDNVFCISLGCDFCDYDLKEKRTRPYNGLCSKCNNYWLSLSNKTKIGRDKLKVFWKTTRENHFLQHHKAVDLV